MSKDCQTLGFRVSEPTQDALESMCDDWGLDKSAAGRRALERGLTQYGYGQREEVTQLETTSGTVGYMLLALSASLLVVHLITVAEMLLPALLFAGIGGTLWLVAQAEPDLTYRYRQVRELA